MSKPVAVITGARGGIGVGLVGAFAEAGYRVVATDRHEGPPIGDEFVLGDLAHLSNNDPMAKRTLAALKSAVGGSLKVLVNNAAVQMLNHVDDIKIPEIYESFETNLFAPLLLTQAFLPELEKAKGSVINMSSVHATATKPGFVTYATTKSALVGLTRAMAVDLGGRVRVNAILPAATDTPMLRAGFEGKAEQFRHLAQMHPIGRIASVSEVAHVAVFLASEMASVVTGAAFAVDGGIGGRLHDPV